MSLFITPGKAIRVSRLRRGCTGIVTSVAGSPPTVERLGALGVAAGVRIRVVQGGSIMNVAIGEARFALGRDWAEAVWVVPA